MLTGRAKAYSSSCSQTVSLSPAISSRLLRGYRSSMPSYALVSFNLENRDLDRLNLCSMLKISYAACPCLSQLVSAQFALAMCLAAESRKKNPQNPLFWRSRSFKVIEFNANQEPVFDFLLVINSNLGPISHRY